MSEELNLANLVKTKTANPPRLIVYGPEGVGKTTFASQAPDVFIMDIEGGLDGIEAYQQEAKTWDDVVAILQALKTQPHKFRFFALDSLDWLEDLIHAKVCQIHNVKTMDDFNYGKGFMYAMDYWMTFTKELDFLRDERRMGSILLAHDKIIRFNDPTGTSYDRHIVNLREKTSLPHIMEWADAVLFLKLKSVVTTEKNGFKESKKAHDAGGVHMYAKKTLSYDAKNRVMLSLPDEFPISRDNAWGDFISQIGKNKPTTQGE